MTALTVPLARLRPGGRFASTWAEFLDWCGDRVAAGSDPWLLYPFGLLGSAALPDLSGPVVYASVHTSGRCGYVGQSLQVRTRFGRHAQVPGRQESWPYVVVCPLAASVPEGFLDQTERFAALLMRPLDGQRHPQAR